MGDKNPFDDNSVKFSPVPAYAQQGGYDEQGAYEANPYSVPPPPPPGGNKPKPPPQQFGDPNDNAYSGQGDNNQIQSLEVAEGAEGGVEKTCKGYHAGPIRYWDIVAGILFILAGILDILRIDSFLDIIVDVYLVGIGLVIVMVEVPDNPCTKTIKNRVYKWGRMFRRCWGKATGLFFFAVLAASDTRSTVKVGCGAAIMVISFFLWYYGAQTAWFFTKFVKKYTAGKELEEDLTIQFEQSFRKYDTDQEGLTYSSLQTLVSNEGYWLNRAEVEIVHSFFDEDYDGRISMEEWKEGLGKVLNRVYFM